jgi:hypothetical protein
VENQCPGLPGSCRRWLYHLAFAIARFLVMDVRYGTSLHRETQRPEAVLSLGGPKQRPAQVRGSQWRRGSRRRGAQRE